MPRPPHILLVTTRLDIASDAVALELARRGLRFTRLNTEDLPFQLSLTYEPGAHAKVSSTSSAAFTADLSSITACWYRRVRSPQRPVGMDEGTYQFSANESYAALLGLLLGRRIPFMSDPARVWAAENKPFQLGAAQAVGLRVPKTIVSNDPDAARDAFAALEGRMIAKPVRSGYLVRDGIPAAVYTSAIDPSALEDPESLRLSPVIYQECVPKAADVRVTIVGTKVFAVEIDSSADADAAVDWRRGAVDALPHRVVDLPASIAARLQMLQQRLGLSFGAIDMIRTPDGEHVFLEVNPSGQWLWLEDRLGLPISSTIVDWLVSDLGPGT